MNTLDHAPDTCIINGHSSQPNYSIVLTRFVHTNATNLIMVYNILMALFANKKMFDCLPPSFTRACGINDNFRSCLLRKLDVVVALRYAQYCSKKHLFRF